MDTGLKNIAWTLLHFGLCFANELGVHRRGIPGASGDRAWQRRDTKEEKQCNRILWGDFFGGYSLFQGEDSLWVYQSVEKKIANVICKEGKAPNMVTQHAWRRLPSLAWVENLWTVCSVSHKKIPWSGKSLAGTKWKMLHKNKMWLLWDHAFQASWDWLYLVGEKPDYQVSERHIDEWIKTEASTISGNLSLGNQTGNHFPVSVLQIAEGEHIIEVCWQVQKLHLTHVSYLLTSAFMGSSVISQMECKRWAFSSFITCHPQENARSFLCSSAEGKGSEGFTNVMWMLISQKLGDRFLWSGSQGNSQCPLRETASPSLLQS